MALHPLASLPQTPLTIKRALLSVSDKAGIVELGKALAEQGVELISTGGTSATLKAAGLTVKDVSEITGFQKCLDGRVKTLHPVVHAGILARTSYTPDAEELQRLQIQPIELVVVNLYPFAQTVSEQGVTLAKATEYIDIGGPTMIRAAAKNFAHVCVLTHPSQYDAFVDELRAGKGIAFDARLELSRAAFNHTASYDAAIAGYLNALHPDKAGEQLMIAAPKAHDLRYGENPHQKSAVYGHPDRYIDCFHGKQLSYNNYLDVDAALRLISDFKEALPTCAIFKHTIPCGVAQDSNLLKAWQKAFECDKVSPFGGIVIVNQTLDLATAQAIDDIFTEIILAPEYSAEALELLSKKANRRLIRVLNYYSDSKNKQIKSIFGGYLVQQDDLLTLKNESFRVVSKRMPTVEEIQDMHFAWAVVKHVKSNAIVYAKRGQTLGIGSGQTSRVDASEIAISKARKEDLSLVGSTVASDAFFPFADGVEAAAKAGATSIIQPGGSVRDAEVIEMADKYNLTMVFTDHRHFKH